MVTGGRDRIIIVILHGPVNLLRLVLSRRSKVAVWAWAAGTWPLCSMAKLGGGAHPLDGSARPWRS